jgi:predicted nucleic acid-binding protein
VAVVVDASVIAAIAFGEPEGPALAAHLSGQTLLAPTLVDYELANIAWKKMRRRPAARPLVVAALSAAWRLGLTRVIVPPVEAFRVADETGLTAYDASYLWVALMRDVELVTLDADLARVSARLRP